MPVSASEYREAFCPACGHRHVASTWMVIDVSESTALRQTLERADAYQVTCPRCRHVHQREMPLLVVHAADVAPVLLACPDEMFTHDDPAAGSAAAIEQTQRILDAEDRWVPGPVLLVPFDVLAVALGRDLEGDLADPDQAIQEIAAARGQGAGHRHGIFLGDVAGSLPLRRLEAAMHAFWSVRSAEDLERATTDHPVLLTEDARDRMRSIINQATAAGDDLGVRIATAHLALLGRCAGGEVAEGWEEYVGEGAYADHVDPRLQELWAQFREARTHDLGLASRIGEELVATSAQFHVVQSEAAAAFETANVYWERVDGDRNAQVERACRLLERALDLCARHPDLLEDRLRSDAILNLAAAFAARGRGDPAANQERALALQREALTMISPDTDGRRWAMVQTNLGLSLIERARALDQRLQNQDDVAQRSRTMIAEAVEHFEAALTWRSFERDPRDWGYTQINLALAYSRGFGNDRRKELRRAIDHLGEAIRGFGAAGDAELLAHALANRANAFVDLAAVQDGQDVEPEPLLEAAEGDVRNAIDAVGDRSGGLTSGRHWWQLARVLAARFGYCEITIGAFERSLEDLTPATAPWNCREAARQLADLATAAGDWERAAAAWQLAVEAGLATVQARATVSGRLAEVAANGNLVRWAAYALIRIERYLEALELLERGRALQLAAWLSGDVVDLSPLRQVSPGLCSHFIDLRRRVELGEREVSAVEDANFPLAVEELQSVVGQIRMLPGFESFLTHPPFTELNADLAEDEAIAYPVTSPWGSAWLVAGRDPGDGVGIEMVDLPAITSTAVFNTLVRFDSASGSAEGYMIEQSSQSRGELLDEELAHVSSVLGPQLMMPLANALQHSGRKSVCLIPIGLLALVPLHALTWEAEEASGCLLDEFEVTYAPSAYIRHVSKRRATVHRSFDRLVVVGNPLPQLHPLAHSEIEAELVAATVPANETLLMTCEAATKDAVLAALPLATHIHLACHGSAASDPMGFDAALWLANNLPASAVEILDLDLSEARLVVASACETGVVAGYDSLDEALALSTIFLAAGAAGAVASLWKVNDYATRLLMARFYEKLIAVPECPARALREAQLWLRDLTVEEEDRFSRPRPHSAGHGPGPPRAIGSPARPSAARR